MKNRKAEDEDDEPLAMRFYMAHRPALTDYAAKVIGDREQAEDIVQEAWLSLSSQRGGTEVQNPLGYLRTMVRNLAIDRLRRRERETRLWGGDMDSATRTVAANEATPEMTASARRDLACVLRVLRALPERQRIAIEMYRFGDYKLREIADHLGVSVSLVHVLISEGLATCANRCGLNGRDLR